MKVEYTTSSKKDQLKVLLKEAYLIDPHTIAASYYRQYKGAVYDIKMSKPDYLKLRCTKDKAGKNGIWTNFKAACKIIENRDYLSGTKPIMCPGTMILYFKDGKVSQPKFEEPFHQCGCLIHLHNMDLGPQDCRPALLMIGPSELSSDLMISAIHQVIINFIDKNVTWTGLSGGRFSGKTMHKYVMDLAHHKAAHNLVEKVMKPYIQQVQRLYPCLVTVKYGAINSLAGCPSQYEGHGDSFHTDYSSFYPNLLPHERPGSIILAMDDFNFKHLPLSTLYRKEIIDINVPPAHAIFFPNSCLHSGGENLSTKPKIRLLLIKVSDGSHLPSNSVTKFEWRNYNKDDLKAVIMHPWGKAGKRGDGEDEEDESRGPNADGRKYAQGVGSKRKRGKDPRNSRQREQ